MAIRIDVVVVVIDRWYENTVFVPFVGMLVGSCFNVCSIVCPSILPGGGQAEVRVGGGPSGIVYGLQVPPQALVPAPGVGLSHAGGGKVRAGGLPLLGGACRHRSAPGAAVAPAPCFLCEIWAQIWPQAVVEFSAHKRRSKTVFTA